MSTRNGNPTVDTVPCSEPTGLRTRVILVGIGGATYSGKTSLAQHLKCILPNCLTVHQDDFWPQEPPINTKWNVPDCDTASGAIDWPRLVSFLQKVKSTGEIPPDHRSYDYLNDQRGVPLADGIVKQWREVFEQLETQMQQEGQQIVWGLVDGFLLYWNDDVSKLLDVSVFLRVPHDELKRRRGERHGYLTADGSLWQDPPRYWERIVYPAYVEAHSEVFEGGNIETGGLTGGKAENLVLIEGLEMSMGSMVENCCKILINEATR